MIAPSRPLKWYKGLSDIKGRLDAGAFLVEGNKAIDQIIDNHPDRILEILTVHEPLPTHQRFPIRTITESQCHYICSTRTPQGTIAVVQQPEDIYADRLPDNTGTHVLVLDDIQDPGNVGTLMRTAAAFDFSGIVMSDKCADPLSPKCVQAAAGTMLSLWIRKTKSYVKLARVFKDTGFTIIAADVKGKSGPSVLDNRNRLLLALGNEGAGLSEGLLKLADYRLSIPTKREKAESLNVAVCGAILMYLSKQLQPTSNLSGSIR